MLRHPMPRVVERERRTPSSARPHLLLHKLFAVLALPLLISGCSSIIDARKQKAPFIEVYETGNYALAAEQFAEKAEDRKDTGDELMWRLEEGTVLFDAAKYKESLAAFEQAETLVNKFDERASVSARDVGAEGGVMVTNLNALPYKGFNYDRILLNAYKALDYFALGKPNDAMVELRRLHERQKDAKQRFESEIEKEQNRIQKQNEQNRQKVSNASAQNPNIRKTNTNVNFNMLLKNKQIASSYQKTEKLSNKAYRDFINPFATYLSAIGYLYDGNSSEALVDFRGLYEMNKSSTLIQRDLVTCARAIGSGVPEELEAVQPYPYPLTSNIVFVIYANGMGAALKQVKVQLILPFVGYCGFAYPELETFPHSYPAITMTAAEQHYQTTAVCNMDAVVASEYYYLLPLIVTRIALSTLTKEIASYIAVRAAQRAGGTGAMLGAYVATGIYKYLFNTADTRCWQTLPGEYQITHFPKPENNLVTLSATGIRKQIQLDNRKNFAIIYVKSPKKGILSYTKFEF